jgi:tetratricopeptide (TPR) repeat protein
MEWAAFNENDDDSQRRERNRHHHREGDFDEENDQNQKQGLIRGENENNNDADAQKRKRRTAEAEETRIAGSYETAIRLLAEEEEEDNNEEGGENVILKEEAKREEAKQILLAVVNHEMMRENDELTPTLCSVKKLALRNLGNLFAKECGEFEFEEEEFEGSEDDKDDSDDDGGEKQRREKLSSKSPVSSQSYSFEQAIRCYSEAVRMDREDVASWLRMGELSAKRGDVALARIAFESGLLAQPTHALLLNELCEVCVLVGDEASATFLAARILNSDRRNERMKRFKRTLQTRNRKSGWLKRERDLNA